MSSKLDHHAEQFGALGHPARLGILRHVVQAGPEGTTATELQDKLGIPWATLSHHIERLVGAGLMVARREGRSVFHTADYKVLRALTDFLWEDCCKCGKASPESCC